MARTLLLVLAVLGHALSGWACLICQPGSGVCGTSAQCRGQMCASACRPGCDPAPACSLPEPEVPCCGSTCGYTAPEAPEHRADSGTTLPRDPGCPPCGRCCCVVASGLPAGAPLVAGVSKAPLERESELAASRPWILGTHDRSDRPLPPARSRSGLPERPPKQWRAGVSVWVI